eukprot:983845-Prymnesium_polylepis.1
MSELSPSERATADASTVSAPPSAVAAAAAAGGSSSRPSRPSTAKGRASTRVASCAASVSAPPPRSRVLTNADVPSLRARCSGDRSHSGCSSVSRRMVMRFFSEVSYDDGGSAAIADRMVDNFDSKICGASHRLKLPDAKLHDLTLEPSGDVFGRRNAERFELRKLLKARLQVDRPGCLAGVDWREAAHVLDAGHTRRVLVHVLLDCQRQLERFHADAVHRRVGVPVVHKVDQ